jgi:hypothetical protein
MHLRRRLLSLAFLAVGVALAADPSLLRMVPADAKFLAGIDVDRARSSTFGQFLLSQMGEREQAGLRELTLKTGFDPRYDLREILVVSAGGVSDRVGMMLARGTFNVPRILNEARTHNVEVSNYKGATLLYLGKEQRGAIAFLGGALVAAGDDRLVRAALDLNQGAGGVGAERAAEISRLGIEYDAWFMTDQPPGAFAHQAPSEEMGGALRAETLSAIRQTSGGVKLGSDVELVAEVLTRSDRDAFALADATRFLAMMITSNAKGPHAKTLMTMAQNMELAPTGSTLRVKVTVPEPQLEEMFRSRRSKARVAPPVQP